TLSILDEAARERLMAALDRARARGGRVVFDSNYRARGWPSVEATRATFGTVLKRVDVALPTFSDESTVWGDAEPRATIDRLHEAGVREVAVKNGEAACCASDGKTLFQIAAEPVSRVVDTTAAGDAFNGGYLAARIAGLDIERA